MSRLRNVGADAHDAIELLGTKEALFVRVGSRGVALDARTGDKLGAFDTTTTTRTTMMPVTAAGVVALETSDGLAVLRERDASPRCVIPWMNSRFDLERMRGSTFVALDDFANGLVASVDGKKVVMISSNAVRVVDVATRTAGAPIALQVLKTLASSPDGRWIHVVNRTGSIAVIDVSANTARTTGRREP